MASHLRRTAQAYQGASARSERSPKDRAKKGNMIVIGVLPIIACRVEKPPCLYIEYAQVFRKVPTVDRVAAGIDWKFMYTKVSVGGQKKGRAGAGVRTVYTHLYI